METEVFWERHQENWSTSPNLRLSYDWLSRDIRLTLTERERENPISLSTFLTPSEALEIATALITAAQKLFEAGEERLFKELEEE